jgi:hypothetical protein
MYQGYVSSITPKHEPQPYATINQKGPPRYALSMCHTIHETSLMNYHINHVSNPHCYATSTCTNIFNNTTQPNYLKHVPYDMLHTCTTRYAINHVLNKYQNSQDVHQA